MPKPTTGRIDRRGPRTPHPAPAPASAGEAPSATKVMVDKLPGSRLSREEDARITDMIMTSVFAGISLLGSVMYFAAFAAGFMYVGGRAAGVLGAQIAFGVGLAVGLLVLGLVLRWRHEALRARSRNLYRGIWIGAIMALILIAAMAYLPHLAFPGYCPPGPACGTIA